jgi:hypothetical protein
MEVYECNARNIDQTKNKVSILFFGDIFLEDLRKYREDKLAEIGLKAFFRYGKYQLTNSFKNLSV